MAATRTPAATSASSPSCSPSSPSTTATPAGRTPPPVCVTYSPAPQPTARSAPTKPTAKRSLAKMIWPSSSAAVGRKCRRPMLRSPIGRKSPPDAPLMQRLNIAHEERLTKWLADAATFRRNQSDVQHEAQIVALLADVIHREEYEYWDDETFAGYRQRSADKPPPTSPPPLLPTTSNRPAKPSAGPPTPAPTATTATAAELIAAALDCQFSTVPQPRDHVGRSRRVDSLER